MKKSRIEPDPVIEFYKKDVDRTLTRENLKLTVIDLLGEITGGGGYEGLLPNSIQLIILASGVGVLGWSD